MNDYQLVHGMVHGQNGLFTPSGEYCLLDFNTLDWGVAAKDVVKVHRLVCLDDDHHIDEFNDAYFGMLSPDDASLVKTCYPFFDAQHYLNLIAVQHRRIGRRTDKRAIAHFREKQFRAWDRLLELTGVGAR
jgi:hypothetical protein